MHTRRARKRRSIWESGKWYWLAALPVGLVILAGSSAFFAVILWIAEPTPWMVSCMAGISLIVAGYSMGRFAGFYRRRKGLKTGAVCGIALYVVLFLSGMLWSGGPGGIMTPLLLLLSSMWGSVAGVNQKHLKAPK